MPAEEGRREIFEREFLFLRDRVGDLLSVNGWTRANEVVSRL